MALGEQEFAALVASAGSALNRGGTRGAVPLASITSTAVAAWRTSPSFGMPVMRSHSSWIVRPARSCRMSPSPSWLPISTLIAPHFGRSQLSRAARRGGPRPAGWRRSTLWHGRVLYRQCMFRAMDLRSRGCAAEERGGRPFGECVVPCWLLPSSTRCPGEPAHAGSLTPPGLAAAIPLDRGVG